MRALFWRRKNARLATRLNTLVEASERVRKSRRRKPPRVTIDTSYIEQTESDAQWVEPDLTCDQDAAPEHLQHHEDVGTGVADALSAGEVQYGGHRSDNEEDEETTILREAIEQLDLAEAGEEKALEREAAALKELEAQRAQVERLEADIAQAQQARTAVEQALEDVRSRAALQPDADAIAAEEVTSREAAEQEADAQRAIVERISADLEQEQKSRAQADADREAATSRADAAELKLADLLEIKGKHEEATSRAAAAEAHAAAATEEAENGRQRYAHLEADMVREKIVRAEAEEANQAAKQQVEDLKRQLDELQVTVQKLSEVEQRAVEAEANVAAARAEADDQRTIVSRLETEIAQVHAALETANTNNDASAERAEAAELELAKLREVAEQLDVANQRVADADARDRAARGEAKAQAAALRRLDNELDTLRETIAEAETNTQAATERAEAAERELAKMRDVAEQLDVANQRVADADARDSAARGEAKAQAAALRRLDNEINTLREAPAEAETNTQVVTERAEAAERELAKLRDVAEQLDVANQRVADADARDSAARGEAKAQAAALRRLDNELKPMRAALAEAETSTQAATERAEMAERELVELRERAGKQSEAAEKCAAEASVNSDGDAQHKALMAELDEVRAALNETKVDAEAANTRACASEQEVADLRAAAAQQTEVEQRCQDAEARAAAVRAEIETERQRRADIEAELKRERAAQETAEVSLEEASKPHAKSASDGDGARISTDVAPAADDQIEADGVEMVDATTSAPVDEPVMTAAKVAEPKLEVGENDELEAGGKAKSAASKPKTQPTKSKSKKATPKRPERITTNKGSASSAEPASTAPASRVESLVQNRIAKATANKEASEDNRRAKRVSSRKLASLWQEGMSAPLSCTMTDRSSTGAKLEVLTDRFNDRMNEITLGDRFTLTQTYAQERTSVACEVMWVDGRNYGVRFCGQILTEIQKPAKKAQPEKSAEKSTTTKAIKSLFSAGTR